PATEDHLLGQLRLPRESVALSRVGRQQAAVIIPDLIYKKEPALVPRVDPLSTRVIASDRVVLQAVEDISQRDGTDKFYFLHSFRHFSSLTPQFLWPNAGDPLLPILACLISGRLSPISTGAEQVINACE